MIEIEELKTLLPHRGRMLLLSRVLENSIEDGTLLSEYYLTEDCIFYDPNLEGVPAWAGFEFIAQSASVLIGIRDRAMGIPPKLGLILSVSQLKVEIPAYKSGSIINIRIKQLDHTDLTYTFDGEIYLEDKLAIKCKLMVIEVNEEDERFADFKKHIKIEGV